MCFFEQLNSPKLADYLGNAHRSSFSDFCSSMQTKCSICVNLFTWRLGGKHETEEVCSPIITCHQKLAITLCGMYSFALGSGSTWASPFVQCWKIKCGFLQDSWKCENLQRKCSIIFTWGRKSVTNIQQSCRSHLPSFLLSVHLKQQHLGFPSFCLYFFTPAVNDAEYSWTKYINVFFSSFKTVHVQWVSRSQSLLKVAEIFLLTNITTESSNYFAWNCVHQEMEEEGERVLSNLKICRVKHRTGSQKILNYIPVSAAHRISNTLHLH